VELNEKGGLDMEIEQGIKKSWESTVDDYNDAHKQYWAALWTEDTLRLNFIRRLSQNLNLKRILAETEYPVGSAVYQPDIIVEVLNDDGATETVVFEMRFFSVSFPKCVNDLEKLKKYREIGCERGYFLAIDYDGACQRLNAELEKLEKYSDPALNYKLSGFVSAQEYGGPCNTTFFKQLIKHLFPKEKPSITVDEMGDYAMAVFDEYGFYFSEQDNKMVALAGFEDPDAIPEEALKKAGYSFGTLVDEHFEPSESGGWVLVKEIPVGGMYKADDMAAKLKKPVEKFRKDVSSSIRSENRQPFSGCKLRQ